MLLTLVGDVGTLAETVVLLLLFVFISTNVAVLVLRKDKVEHDHFRVWTWVPVLASPPACCCSPSRAAGLALRRPAARRRVVLYFVARATGRRTGRDHEAGAHPLTGPRHHLTDGGSVPAGTEPPGRRPSRQPRVRTHCRSPR